MEESYGANLTQALPNILTRPQNPEPQNRVIPKMNLVQSVSGGANGARLSKVQYGRNDKVTISNGKETVEVKYKKAEALLQTGEWKIVS
jgi:hypothetical protein